MSKPAKTLIIYMPTVDEDGAITTAAQSDPDAQPLTSAQLKTMTPIKNLHERTSIGKKSEFICTMNRELP